MALTKHARGLRRLTENAATYGAHLTRTERAVLGLLIRGLSVKQIARVRGCSASTVNTHTNRMRVKAGADCLMGTVLYFCDVSVKPRFDAPRDLRGLLSGNQCQGKHERTDP